MAVVDDILRQHVSEDDQPCQIHHVDRGIHIILWCIQITITNQ